MSLGHDSNVYSRDFSKKKKDSKDIIQSLKLKKDIARAPRRTPKYGACSL